MDRVDSRNPSLGTLNGSAEERSSIGAGRIRFWLVTAAWSLSLLAGLCVLTFFLSYVAPGDPARIILGPNATESSVVALRTEMGFDKPLPEQFAKFLGQMVTGKWGQSWITRRPVMREILDHLSPTLSLGVLASIYSLAAALAMNGLAFVFPRAGGWFIPTLRLGIALPSFVVAVATAVTLAESDLWTSAAASGFGSGNLGQHAIPAVAVALYPACVMTTLLRDRFGDVLGSSYFRAARSLGYSRWQLFARVLVPNSRSILFTAWVNQISLLVFSTIIVEHVFSFRGLGALLIRSIQGKDLPVLAGIILLNGCFFLVVRAIAGNSSGGGVSSTRIFGRRMDSPTRAN